jgi:GR25 family glycosyltransferase involved in LPS biosynthesis
MKVCFINLDSAAERRDYLEKNFAQYNKNGWRLERFPAITNHRLAEYDFPFSRIRDVEACCFLSHMEAITRNINLGDDLMMVEDDVSFGPTSQDIIEFVIRNTPRDSWDIIFTDICVLEMNTMLDLYNLKRQLAGQVKLLDLVTFATSPQVIKFAGSTAYIINRDRIGNLVERLTTNRDVTLPYDICLWKLILDKLVAAHVIFPFPTTLSPLGDSSQVQMEHTAVNNILWDTFRRLVWFDSDLSEAEKSIARIDESYIDDKAAHIMARIIEGLIGKNFRQKSIHNVPSEIGRL